MADAFLGRELGPYELLEVVGRGATATVYRARQSSLGRLVAVKVMHETLVTDPTAVARFQRELKVAASVSHPNLVHLLDGDLAHTPPYIVMELVKGSSLAAHLERHGPLPWAKAIAVTGALAEALAHLHAHDILHRDLKPANVLLDETGGVKLADFGLARLQGGTLLTAEGSMLGTFAFASPEVLQGEAATKRSDLWSLGATLHRMLTGVPISEALFMPDWIGAVIAGRITPVEQVAHHVPPHLLDLVKDLLAPDPAARPPSAAAVVERLRATASAPRSTRGKVTPVAVVTVERRSVASKALAGIAVLLALVAGWKYHQKLDFERDRDRMWELHLRRKPAEALFLAERLNATDPRHDLAALVLVESLVRLGRIEAAQAKLIQIRKDQPHHAELAGRMGDLMLEQGRFDEARRMFEEVERLAPGAGQIRLSRLHRRKRALPEAEAAAREATRRLPQSAHGWTELAVVLHESQRLPEAIEAADQAIQLDPKLPGARFIRAASLDRLGRSAEATEVYRQVMESDPTNIDAHVHLANNLINHRHLANAEPVIDELLALAPEEPSHHALRGILRRQQKKLDEARRIFEQILEKTPDQQQALVQLAGIELELGRPQQAEAMARQGIERTGKELPFIDLLADALQRRGKTADAELALRRAIVLDPLTVSSRIRLTSLLYDRGELDEAMQLCEQVLSIDARHPYPLSQAAEIAMQQGRAEEAIRWLERWREVAPQEREPRYRLATVYEKKGDLVTAARLFEQVVEGEPPMPHLEHHLAKTLVKLEDWDGAEKYYRRAIEHDPGKPELQLGLELVKARRRK